MGMEGKLILTALGLLVFGQFLRKIKNYPEKITRYFVLIHSVFGIFVGGFLGFFISLYASRPEPPSPSAVIFGAISGFVLFFFYGLIFRKNLQRMEKIFKTDYDWVETGWSALLLAGLIMYWVIQAFEIPSGSMRQTFLEGDHLFVNKFIYGLRVPFTDGKRILPLRKVRRGDIVIFEAPPKAYSAREREKKIKKDFVKRCIGVGGDVVEIRQKQVYLNGQLLSEPYVQFVDDFVYPKANFFRNNQDFQKAWEEGSFAEVGFGSVRDNFGPVVVPPGCYLVLGDNRDRSFDSRFWGPLPDKYVKGKPLVIYWPIKRIRFFPQ